MHKSTLLSFGLTLIGAVFVQSQVVSIADEKACIEKNLQAVHELCKEKIPEDVRAGVETCFFAERDNGFIPKIKQCMNDNGIADSSPCIKLGMGSHDHGRTREGRSAGFGSFPVESPIMKAYLECAHEANSQQPKCDTNCNAPDDNTKKTLFKCVKQSWSKPGEQGSLATCLNDVLKGQ